MILLRQRLYSSDKYIDELRKDAGGKRIPKGRNTIGGIVLRTYLSPEKTNDQDINTVHGMKNLLKTEWGFNEDVEPFAVDIGGNVIATNNKTKKIVLIDHENNKQLVLANSPREFKSKLYSEKTDFDKAVDKIYSYEKKYGKTKHLPNDFAASLEKFDENDKDPRYTDVYFQAKVGSKIYNTYGPDFYWAIRKNNKTGECEFLEAGD